MKRLLPVIALLSLTACQSISGRSGGEIAKAPPPTIEAALPPEACAALPVEPAPPSVDASKIVSALIDALGPDIGLSFWQWLTVDERGYKTEVTRRLAAIKTACK